MLELERLKTTRLTDTVRGTAAHKNDASEKTPSMVRTVAMLPPVGETDRIE